MNRYTFLDLSINGIKIDINDISDNNFTKNSNNFNLDGCSDKKHKFQSVTYKITDISACI